MKLSKDSLQKLKEFITRRPMLQAMFKRKKGKEPFRPQKQHEGINSAKNVNFTDKYIIF